MKKPLREVIPSTSFKLEKGSEVRYEWIDLSNYSKRESCLDENRYVLVVKSLVIHPKEVPLGDRPKGVT